MATPKRERLVQGLDRFGLLWVLQELVRRAGVIVLAYHRVGGSAGELFDSDLLSASPDEFRRQMLHMRSHFDVIGLEQLIARLTGSGPAIERPTAMVTFDDGYRDNYEVALPILEEVGLPAVFFIAAGYIDHPRLPWWDRIAHVVKSTRRDTLELQYPEPMSVDLRQLGTARAVRQILRCFKSTKEIDESRFFDGLETGARVAVDSEALGRDLFMDWSQVRALSASGMAIGSHTYDHPVLARLPETVQLSELTRSKQVLEERTGHRVDAIAYPVGGRDAFTASTKRLAGEAGYRAAFSYYGGFNRPQRLDLFDLRRVAVERDDSWQMFRFKATMSTVAAGYVP